jgi:hypothetical protein
MSFDTLSKIIYRIKHRIAATKASEVRLAFRVYSDPDDRKGWWFFLLRCCSLTHEVFLHNQLGQRFITLPKAIIGMGFFFLCRIIAGYKIPFDFSIDFTVPGVFKFILETGAQLMSDVIRLIQHHEQTKADFLDAMAGIQATFRQGADGGLKSGDPLPLAIAVYGAMVNLRLLEIFVYNRLNILKHPHSSGEPQVVWTPFYWIAGVFRLRIDVVKQACEPVLCILAGAYILDRESLKDWHMFGTWLQLGAVCVGIRVYLENKTKNALYQEQIANQLNAASLQAQQKLLSSETDRAYATVKSNS